MASMWTEIGDRVFVRRYKFFDQNIVAILGTGETLVVDTRTSPRQAEEIKADLRELTAPPVTVVVDTHGHSDHVFGNHSFRPCRIWGHHRCVPFMSAQSEHARAALIAQMPDMADEFANVVIDPPDQLFSDKATLEFGGRQVELRHLGRGHTDNDIVLVAQDADVVCAGDLLENGATPYFGDGFPMDWPQTAQRLLDLVGEKTVVVPGHGDHAGQKFAEASLTAFTELATLARQIYAGQLDLEAATTQAPYPAKSAREPIARALAQLRGELDP
jgi:glyoxylase-like metal-dependent hydrolase (beta-lactamase superfamily II)